MVLENVCQYFKYGYCKYKTRCRMTHIEEECNDKPCSEKCNKRHPKACFYWVKFGDCKLGRNCAYKHEKNRDMMKLELKIEELNKKINEKDDLLATKLNDLIEKIKEKDQIIEGLLKDVSKLKTNVDKKQENENEQGADDDNDLEKEYDEATVEEKAKDFCMRSLSHLDDMEKQIKRSRKNFKDKSKNFTDKMESEIYNFDLSPGIYKRHYNCVYEVCYMQNAIEEIDANNEKEKILKLIEFCKINFKLVYEDKERFDA